MKSAYLLIAHGSREAEANEAFFEFIERFRKTYPDRQVEGSFLELAKPTIAQGIENCIAQGAQEIIVLPMMFFRGRHVKQDIPKLIQEAKARHPEVDFHYAGSISEHPLLLALFEEKARQTKGKS